MWVPFFLCQKLSTAVIPEIFYRESVNKRTKVKGLLKAKSYRQRTKMTSEEKSKIKTEIEEKIKLTKNKIISLKEQTKPIPPDSALGRLTRMDAIQQKSLNEESLRKAEQDLHNSENTLKLIDNEHFGICVKCKQTIPIGRILLVPESKLCVPCANQR